MEEEIVKQIATVKETRKRLELADTIYEYFKKDASNYNDIKDFGCLIGGLANWIRSPSLQVSMTAMKILTLIVTRKGKDFFCNINTIFDPLMGRLGDWKVQAQDCARNLIQVLLSDCSEEPHSLMDRILQSCLVHKNWRVKEQGLCCFMDFLKRFGIEKLDIDKLIPLICISTSDANSQVRSVAMDTLAEIYYHIGTKLYAHILKCNISPVRMKALSQRLKDLTNKSSCPPKDLKVGQNSDSGISGDLLSGSWSCNSPRASSDVKFKDDTLTQLKHRHVGQLICYSSTESFSPSRTDLCSAVKYEEQTKSGVSKLAASSSNHVNLQSNSQCSMLSHRLSALHLRYSTSGSALSSSTSRDTSGLFAASDIEHDFSDITEKKFQTKSGLEKCLRDISKLLTDNKVPWDIRLSALKEIRVIVKANGDTASKEDMKSLISDLDTCLIASLKDPRSQVIREACVTVSYLSLTIGHNAITLAVRILPTLISLLVKPVKIIAKSAENSTETIIKHSPSTQILQGILNHGFLSKSALVRRYSAKFLIDAVKTYELKLLSSTPGNLVQDMLSLAIRDADETTRKLGRQGFWEYHRKFPLKAKSLLLSFTTQEQKYINDAKCQTNTLALDVRHSSSSLLSSAKSETESKHKKTASYTKIPCLMNTKPSSTSSALFQQNGNRSNISEAANFLGFRTPRCSMPARSMASTIVNKQISLESVRRVSTSASDTSQKGNYEPRSLNSLQTYKETLYPVYDTGNIKNNQHLAVLSKSKKRPVRVSNNSSALSTSQIDRRRVVSHEPKKVPLGSHRDKRTISTQFGARNRNVGVQVRTPKSSIGIQKTCSLRNVFTQTESDEAYGKEYRPRKIKMKLKNIKPILNEDAGHQQISNLLEENIAGTAKHGQSINLPSISHDTSKSSNLVLQCHLKALDKGRSIKDGRGKLEYALPSILPEKQYLELFSGFEKALEQVVCKFLYKHNKARNEVQESKLRSGPQTHFPPNDASCTEALTVNKLSKNDLSAISFDSTLEAMSVQDLPQALSGVSFIESSETLNPSPKTVSEASLFCKASGVIVKSSCSVFSISRNSSTVAMSEKYEICGPEPLPENDIDGTDTYYADKLEESSGVMCKQTTVVIDDLEASTSNAIESFSVERIPGAEEESTEFEAVNVTMSQDPLAGTPSVAEGSSSSSPLLPIESNLQDSSSVQLEHSAHASCESCHLNTSLCQENIPENDKLCSYRKSSNTNIFQIDTQSSKLSEDIQLSPSSESQGSKPIRQLNSNFFPLTTGKITQKSEAHMKDSPSNALKHSRTILSSSPQENSEVSLTAIYPEPNVVNTSKIKAISCLPDHLTSQKKHSISIHYDDELQGNEISVCRKEKDNSNLGENGKKYSCPRKQISENQLCQIDGYLPATTSVEITTPEIECFNSFTAKFNSSIEPLHDTYQNHLLSSSEQTMATTHNKSTLPSNQVLDVSKLGRKNNLESKKISFLLPTKSSIHQLGYSGQQSTKSPPLNKTLKYSQVGFSSSENPTDSVTSEDQATQDTSNSFEDLPSHTEKTSDVQFQENSNEQSHPRSCETTVPITRECKNANATNQNKTVCSGGLACEFNHLQFNKRQGLFYVLYSKLVSYSQKELVATKSAEQPAKEIAAIYLRRAALHFNIENILRIDV